MIGRAGSPPTSLSAVSRDSASTAGGAAITLTGGFVTGASAIVRIGGYYATDVVVVNSTTITCTVGAGPVIAPGPLGFVAADIVVTQNRASVTLSNAFKYWFSKTQDYVLKDFEDNLLTPLTTGSTMGTPDNVIISTGPSHSGTNSVRARIVAIPFTGATTSGSTIFGATPAFSAGLLAGSIVLDGSGGTTPGTYYISLAGTTLTLDRAPGDGTGVGGTALIADANNALSFVQSDNQQNDIVSSRGRWVKWWFFIPTATYNDIKTGSIPGFNAQIKFFLCRATGANHTLAVVWGQAALPNGFLETTQDNGNVLISVAPQVPANTWNSFRTFIQRSPTEVADSGTAQAVTATTITLDSATIFTHATDECRGAQIVVAGQASNPTITAYNKTTKVATIASWPSGTPGAPPAYQIIGVGTAMTWLNDVLVPLTVSPATYRSANIGNNDPTTNRSSQFGLTFTQYYGQQTTMYIDDVTISDGFID